jgi:hypothetical protein
MSFQPTEGRVGARSFTHSRCKLKLVELALELLQKDLKSTVRKGAKSTHSQPIFTSEQKHDGKQHIGQFFRGLLV